MKGLSILLTLALLVLAQQLSIYLKRAGALATADRSSASTPRAETNSRLALRQTQALRAPNYLKRRSLEQSNQSPVIGLEI